MIARFVIVAVAITLSGVASAYPLPEFNTTEWCSRVKGYGAYTRKTCTDDNDAAKMIAKAEWAKIPPHIQEGCAKSAVATAPGGGSYLLLKSCLKSKGFAKD